MTTPSNPLFATFIGMLLDTLATMVPGSDDDTGTRQSRRDIARVLFEALQPRDAIEAMLAARAVAAHHAAMDGFARAAQPGTADEQVIRLRTNAIAAGRAFDTMLRTLDKRHKEPAAAKLATPRTEPSLPFPLRPQVPSETPARANYRDSTALTMSMVQQPERVAALTV